VQLNILVVLSVQGFLLSGPVNVKAHLGDTVQLNCRSNLSNTVRWIRGHLGTTTYTPIFEATSDKKGYISLSFQERFSCVREGDGYQNLTIRNVSFSDTGNYTCVDDEGFGYDPRKSSYGRWGSASLEVTGEFYYFIKICHHQTFPMLSNWLFSYVVFTGVRT